MKVVVTCTDNMQLVATRIVRKMCDALPNYTTTLYILCILNKNCEQVAPLSQKDRTLFKVST